MSEFDTRLIELVRANPKLYERELRSTPYEAHKKRNSEIWRSISTSLNTEVSSCVSRWNHLVAKQRRELAKEKSGGTGSDWSLLPHLHFLQHHHQPINHRNPGEVRRNSLKSIEEVNDEEDPLQEAMDEQLAVAATAAPPTIPAPAQAAAPVRAEKRIEALLEGLGEANRIKAEKRILAYLCKCNLRALNDEQIDDIVI
ncbi:transcription factor Adf-1 [Drosophila eugracilis]|uniref:transcription factor Adf-1 n=1 Tax=Drosophila eugracilis TaxID=29029 RepID=UPI0007E850DE|nr:transcription factor Adf-1 [Drosophila eugracilis]